MEFIYLKKVFSIFIKKYFYISESDDDDAEWKVYIGECRDLFDNPESEDEDEGEESDEQIVCIIYSNSYFKRLFGN